MNITQKFYDQAYNKEGLYAQRRWPNEELCRFFGRNFFSVPYSERKDIKILEVGCGSGADLKMIYAEGFDTYGVDLSYEAVKLVPAALGTGEVNVSQGDMTELKYPDNFFDCVVDVYSSVCLDEMNYKIFSEEAKRILKKNGMFFSYTPAKSSDAFVMASEKDFLDKSTLKGMMYQNQPFYGNDYPFRFMNKEDVAAYWEQNGFSINYMEKISKTYFNMKTRWDILTYEVEKK